MILSLLLALLQDPAALGEKAYRDGKFAEAADHFEKALSQLKEKERPASLWLALGHASLQAKRWDAAIRAYREAIALKADTAEAYRGLGQAQWSSGLAEDSLRSFHRAATLDPDGSDLLTIARIRAQREEWLLAENVASAHLRADPASIDGLEVLSYVLTREGKWSEAAGVYRALTRRKPAETRYLIAWAQAESAQRRYGEAADLLELATRIGAPDADALRLLADLYLQLQMYSEAATTYGRMLGAAKDARADDWIRLGHAYLRSRQPVSARAAFEKARALDPSNSSASLELASLAASRGETELARKEFAAAGAGLGWTAWESLGDFEFQAGRFSEAAAAYAEAVRRGTSNVGTRSNLVFALESAGKTEEARQALREALRRYPLDDKLRNQLRQMDK